MECQCEKCKRACAYKLGWFAPGEVEKVAEFLGMSIQELFDTRLCVDYWVGGADDGADIYLLSPAIRGRAPGAVLPFDPRGECEFFTVDGLCEIHSVKPHECRETSCQSDNGGLHERVAMMWREHQDEVEELLGEAPLADESDFFSAMTILFDW